MENMRHICSTCIRKFVNDVDPQNYEGLFPREQRLFSRPFWPYSLHTFSLVSLVKKYATCKAKMAFQKAFISRESDVHCFSDPIINAFYNECGKDTVLQILLGNRMDQFFKFKNFLTKCRTIISFKIDPFCFPAYDSLHLKFCYVTFLLSIRRK